MVAKSKEGSKNGSTPAEVAILDMHNGRPNQGMRCIQNLITASGMAFRVYDSRGAKELPKLGDHDVFISTGGPDDPHEYCDSDWGKAYGEFLDSIVAWNENHPDQAKNLFLICYSFQVACIHWKIGSVTNRNSTAFGIRKMMKTPEGKRDPLLCGLPTRFNAIDNRDWQLIDPQPVLFENRPYTILSHEVQPPPGQEAHAVTAIRFSRAIVGTQFHPEGESTSLLWYLNDPIKSERILRICGRRAYNKLKKQLQTPDIIDLTNRTVLPNYLANFSRPVAQFSP
jgi:GMP synthase-like glutamine amidotransferase